MRLYNIIKSLSCFVYRLSSWLSSTADKVDPVGKKKQDFKESISQPMLYRLDYFGVPAMKVRDRFEELMGEEGARPNDDEFRAEKYRQAVLEQPESRQYV